MVNHLPLVSVIIPCFNYGLYIEEAVNSVKRSTYINVEIIVVDDGSTDQHTLEVLESLAENGIIVIHQANQGLSGARNTGFNTARGKYVLPLDADDMIAPSLLEIGVWLLERRPEAGFVYCYAKIFGTENYIWHTSRYDFIELLQHNFIPATALVRKSVWAAAGGYDPDMRGGYEDWEFWIRLGSMGHTGIMVEDTLFYYRRHGPSMLSQSNKSRQVLINYIRQKHRRLYLNPLIRIWMAGAALRVVFSRRLAKSRLCNRARRLLLRVRAVQDDVHYIRMDAYRKRVRQNIELPMGPIKLPVSEKTPVLIILPWLEVGGVEQVFYNLISQLDRNKFDVYMVTTLYGENLWKDKFAERCKGVFHLPYFTMGSNEAGMFIMDFIRCKGIRVVHISNSKLGYSLAPVIKKNFPEVKIIDLLHMDEPDAPWDYFRVGDLVKEYIDVRVVLTEYYKMLLMNRFKERPGRIEVIPNGINLAPFMSRHTDEKKWRVMEGTLCIAFVGRLHHQKEPMIFVRVAEKLLELKQDIRFLMVGDGPLRGEVEGYINSRCLNDYISMTGFSENVAGILVREVDLLLAPSKREGLPVVGIEALAAGVPVVASDVPGWDQIIIHGVTGYLVSGGEIEGFVACCLNLLKTRGAVLEMGRRCREIATEKYDRKVMAAAYERIYLG